MPPNENLKNLKLGFFGTPNIAVIVLEKLKDAGILPAVVITNPDAPRGRNMMLTPPPVKVWAQNKGIPILQPQSLRTDNTVEEYLRTEKIELCIVVAYGKIIPESLLQIPRYGILNVHPSLLPELRGASPIRSAILRDMRETGVTIMLLDAELDHGPILAQEKIVIDEGLWPPKGRELDTLLAEKGGELLSKTLPRWIEGSLAPTEQDHVRATFSEKITKEMGEIDLTSDPHENFLKIRAFDGWPGTYFFTEKNGKRMRVKIVDAELGKDGTLQITRIIPEGRNELDYKVFMEQENRQP